MATPYNPFATQDKRVLGMSRRGQAAYRGGTMATTQPALPQMQQQGQQTMFQPMGAPPRPQGFMAGPMGPAMPADVFPRPPAPQGPPQAMDPRQMALSQMLGMGRAGGRPDPTMKALIDSMTGARVHKGMDGRQLGMEGVDPNVKYMLYAMRGRRHKGMDGKDIY